VFSVVLHAHSRGAGRRECFYLEVAKEEVGEVTVQVSVIKGGLLDILIDVFDPHDNKLFSRMFFEGKGDSDIKFNAEVSRQNALVFLRC
jgi:hypothetical protein